MTYDSARYGFETQRMDGTATGAVFNGIQFSYSTLAGGNFTLGGTITDTTTAATGIIRDIIIDSATTGRLAVEAPTGLFNNTNNLQQGAVTAVQSSGSLAWSDIYAPGGFLEGVTLRTRPGTIHQIIVERPMVTGAGTSNILVLNWPDTRLAAGPPVSGNTSSAYQPVGAATTGSYDIQVHFDAKKGMLMRFENLAPSVALICAVFKPHGRDDFIQGY